MKKKMRNIVVKTLVGVLLISGFLTTENIGSAASLEGKIIVQRDQSVLVGKNKVKKDSKTGSSAYIKFKNKISNYDTVTFSIMNAHDLIVSTGDNTYRNIPANTSKAVSYKSGKGKQGNYFRTVFGLLHNSQSLDLTFNYKFTP